jgi:exopolyphosphatase/pppGpp-phosphohydrolase
MDIDLATARAEVFSLMSAMEREPAHVRQVARLALRLYDELMDLHGGGAPQRFLLESAALLHDIGWSVAPDGASHHKHSARLILEGAWVGLPAPEVAQVAQIARYHRKSLPQAEHVAFMALSETDRGWVEKLAGLLRIADGLDRTHRQKVADLSAETGPDEVLVVVRGGGLEEELVAGRKKSDLAERAYGRKWIIREA